MESQQKELIAFTFSRNYLLEAHAVKPGNQTQISFRNIAVPGMDYMVRESGSIVSSCGSEDYDIFVCCTEASVLLLHWDSILGDWERFTISEGEGRISKLSLTSENKKLWICAVKWDSVVVYVISTVHSLDEPGPLLMENIQCFTTIDKTRDATVDSHCFVEDDHLFITLLSTTLSMKMHAIDSKGNQKLLKQQFLLGSNGAKLGSSTSEVITDLTFASGYRLLLVLASDGNGELLHLHSTGFTLLNRIKLQNLEDSSLVGSDSWNVITAKFVPPHEPKIEEDGSLFQKFANPIKFPELKILVVSTNNISVINIKSGHTLKVIKFQEVPGFHELVPHDCKISNTFENASVSLALQPFLSQKVLLTKLNLHESKNVDDTENIDPCLNCSFVFSEPLQPKSVLRKRFKSPPPTNQTNFAKPRSRKRLMSFKSPAKPAWISIHKAKSRSRPSPKKTQPKAPQRPATARSEESADNVTFNLRPVHLPKPTMYCLSEEPDWKDKYVLNSGLMDGHSYLRLAFSPDGKTLAGGGSTSPVAIMKAKPIWEGVSRLKEFSRVTSLHFNFSSKYLLVGTNDCVTKILSWRKQKEVLNIAFTSKFNEHIHSQFYFMDKFVLQPQSNCVVLYAIKKSEIGENLMTKAEVANITLRNAQNISALCAPNMFFSSQILVGLSNKSLDVLDMNTETVRLSLKNAHCRPISCIRINEAPLSLGNTDIILTACPSPLDPIKLWDLRSGNCVLRLSDVSSYSGFIPNSRPAMSPCGRFIATGMEDQAMSIYDTRKLDGRLSGIGGLKSPVLDIAFDAHGSRIFGGMRNGCFIAIYP